MVGKEMLSFHKGSRLHQPLAWVLVSACFTSGSLSLSLFPSLAPPCEASFALNDFHVEVSPSPLTK